MHKSIATIAACTIVSKNYFAYAKTLAGSYLSKHPGARFVILVVDESSDRERFTYEGAEVLFLEDLKIDGWRRSAFMFDIMELNTNVKPSLLRHLLTTGSERALYLDPDIFVYSSLSPIYQSLESASVVLTPHALSPPTDEFRPADRDFLKVGVYNLGFIGVAKTESTERFLRWWEQRCLSQGFNEVPMGWFVDQKWIDLVPCYFDGVEIFKAPGANMAYWNLHERVITHSESDEIVINGEAALLFFHFSGISAHEKDTISRHQNRFDLIKRPDLRQLFAHYRKALIANGYDDFIAERYAFSTFSDGKTISPLLRRAYASLPLLQSDPDPFDSHSAAYAFGCRNRLIARGNQPRHEIEGVNSMRVDENDDRLRIAARLMRFALRIAGVQRLQALAKFMRYFGTLNNLAVLMFRPPIEKR